ncbi:unnamed protein product [Effrenium voratum]|uniref:Uncharacterized protein n=1 Tax=Effrenium voratum TaxID=2562239 RepID=A0AA36NDD6_9DINO|nr:unnamed protein product [Effrenium voratum]
MVYAFEHGGFSRAMLAELLFKLTGWKWRTGFDVLNSERLTSDRKIRIDAAVLQEETVSDSLAKWHGNGVLENVMGRANGVQKNPKALEKGIELARKLHEMRVAATEDARQVRRGRSEEESGTPKAPPLLQRACSDTTKQHMYTASTSCSSENGHLNTGKVRKVQSYAVEL